ncbi:hypothetical protein BSPWISOXPB_3880 [uncultured Gammaproteobacteria bacterium]|nr:hypothetical protein BSPWISOXPB_3880 [uncultured Gammaproteobacteria bacterium]
MLLLLLVGRQGRWFWLLGWMLLGRYWFDSIFCLLVDHDQLAHFVNVYLLNKANVSFEFWLEGLGVVLVVGLDLVGMLNRHLLLWISFVWRF